MARRPERRKPENRNPERIEPVAKETDPGSVLEGLGSFSKILVAGNPIRSDGKFAELCDQGDRDRLEQRPPHLSCRHFNVPSTASPHAHLDRSPWGMADKTWLEAVGRAPGKNSPWYRSHVEAIRPKLSHRHAHSTPVAGARSQSQTGAAAALIRGGAPCGPVVWVARGGR